MTDVYSSYTREHVLARAGLRRSRRFETVNRESHERINRLAFLLRVYFGISRFPYREVLGSSRARLLRDNISASRIQGNSRYAAQQPFISLGRVLSSMRLVPI